MPSIRLFPHDPIWYEKPESLTEWLQKELRTNGGRYRVVGSHAKGAPAKADMQPGSLVLFRHGDVIVGEAVVRDYEKPAPADDVDALAVVSFAPTSIRLYSPPVTADELQQIINQTGSAYQITVPRTYYSLDWNTYPGLLALIVARGSFT